MHGLDEAANEKLHRNSAGTFFLHSRPDNLNFHHGGTENLKRIRGTGALACGCFLPDVNTFSKLISSTIVQWPKSKGFLRELFACLWSMLSYSSQQLYEDIGFAVLRVSVHPW